MENTPDLSPLAQPERTREEMLRENMEREIRAMCGSIKNAFYMRQTHPTMGYTKTGIRRDHNFLRGMVAAYAFMTDQTANALGVHPLHVHYLHPETRDKMLDVHDLMATL